MGYSIQPESAGLVGNGYALLKRKQYERAAFFFQQLQQYYPNDPNTYDCLGDLYSVSGDKPKAIEKLQERAEPGRNEENARQARRAAEREIILRTVHLQDTGIQPAIGMAFFPCGATSPIQCKRRQCSQSAGALLSRWGAFCCQKRALCDYDETSISNE
ncbi:M48 family metallopeptidase [Massilia sp. BJB1822]|uniref:tetratricopeptide repeat protein n=1 Tax=Massilia sp. BJB1822 TaxID=2744470 RepID=UPI0015946445|nr:hypothetical protein [Massilia sp. BJB1822]NVE00070.1 hypothetical protein [Massilia sp. BJB1822]